VPLVSRMCRADMGRHWPVLPFYWHIAMAHCTQCAALAHGYAAMFHAPNLPDLASFAAGATSCAWETRAGVRHPTTARWGAGEQ
jgi:hypothetical protein